MTSVVIVLTKTKLAGLVTVEGKMDWPKSSSAYGGQFKLSPQRLPIYTIMSQTTVENMHDEPTRHLATGFPIAMYVALHVVMQVVTKVEHVTSIFHGKNWA